MRWAILSASVLAVVIGACGGDRARSARVSGSAQIVFDWSRDACAPNDIPDLPARAFRDAEGRVQLLISHYVNRRMVGRDLDHLRHPCAVIMHSRKDADPAAFADREWLAAVYTRDGRTVFALVHDEYQGHRHLGRCPSGSYVRCWYNTITSAVSRDGGQSFSQQKPAALVAVSPYRYRPDSGPYGLFSPSNIIFNRKDRYHYAFVRTNKFGAQAAGSCLIRTAAPEDPSSWRAWDGSAFSIEFVDPYDVPPPDPSRHVCRPVAPAHIQSMSQSLTFNTYLNRFVLVGRATAPGRTTGRMPGVYISLSRDLLHWTQRRLLMRAELRETYRCGDRDPIAYPALIDPSSRSRNFDVTGKNAYLYFTRSHFRNCHLTLDRDLVRVPVRFSK